MRKHQTIAGFVNHKIAKSLNRTILLSAMFATTAYSAEVEKWQAPVLENGKEKGYSCKVVDYGDDYCHYRNPDQFLYKGEMINGKKIKRNKFIYNLDLDGDGIKKDTIEYIPFSETKACVPLRTVPGHFDWDEDGMNARIFEARLGYAIKGKMHITEGGGPNQDHSIHADDINFMAWTKRGYMAGGSDLKGWGLFLWRKEDFLNRGDNHKVSFDEKSVISLSLPRYWSNMKEIRFVAQDGDKYYVSEYKIEEKDGKDPAHGQVNYVNPTKTKWALYPVKAPYDIIFDASKATFSKHDFKDVRSVGYFMESIWCGNYWLKIGAFEVNATVNRPEQTSTLLDMKKITGKDDVPEFEISSCEVPYAAYAKIYRPAVSNSFTMKPGYYFDKEADMGSMAFDDASHYPAEPATDITWLDAVNWCNALSEQEGKEPVYYNDPEFKHVFRRTQERFLIDYSKNGKKRHKKVLCKKEVYQETIYGENSTSTKEIPYVTYTPTVYVKWEADGYRLPTAKEWEIANSGQKSEDRGQQDGTVVVGSGKANKNGLYDMNGNVWEYIWDLKNSYNPDSDIKHTVLGGSFNSNSDNVPSVSVDGDKPFKGMYNIGFRVVARKTGLKTPSFAIADSKINSWTFDKSTQLKGSKKEIVKPELVSIKGGTFPHRQNRNDPDTQISISPFSVSKTEITYKQWKGVYNWAINNGYKFNWDGDMGSMYYKIGDKAHSQNEPVTRISWWDMAVWCNAKSEMENKKPCFYINNEILKTALPTRHPQEFIYNGAGKVGLIGAGLKNFNISIDWSADGYRLPTYFEFNYLVDKGHKKKINIKKMKSLKDYAWIRENSDFSTHDVATKKADDLGLYDIFGNVDELCMDSEGKWKAADTRNPKLQIGNGIATRGGGFINYQNSGSSLNEKSAVRVKSYNGYVHCGFRIVSSPYSPIITIDGKKYTLIGENKDKIKEGAFTGKGIIDETNRTIEIK